MVDEYIDLVSGEVIKQGSSSNRAQSQNITINDATSEVGKILVKEFGSDIEFKQKGSVDVRRFSNIASLDVFWLMYFQNIGDLKGGKFAQSICDAFLNNRYSVNGGHKKITIDFQDSLGGDRNRKDPTDKRNIIQKYITQRGKEPTE